MLKRLRMSDSFEKKRKGSDKEEMKKREREDGKLRTFQVKNNRRNMKNMSGRGGTGRSER